jgi:undecaprenyl-diphosphatase
VDHALPEPVARKLSPVGRYGLRATLFGIAVVLVGIPFGLLLEQVVREGTLTEWDSAFAEHLHRWVVDRPVAVDVLEVISFMGKPIFLFFLIGIPATILLARGKRRSTVFLIVTSIGGGLVDTAVKVAVSRPRPEFDDPVAHAFGQSFPSGHAMSSIICYGGLVLVVLPMVSRRGRPALIGAAAAIVIAISVSRLALGVHFLSDVLGGLVLGAAWLVASVAAFEIWREERGKRPTQPLKEGVEPEEVAA